MIEIGRLLRSYISGCVFGTWVDVVHEPALGGMVKIAADQGYSIFGLIYDIRVEDDGLVRQLLSSRQIAPEIMQDNRRNRNVPVEISVLFLGYEHKNVIYHLLPPRPPLSLDEIFPCTPDELDRFTNQGFGYFRHILRDPLLPAGELLAAHFLEASTVKSKGWLKQAAQELIVLLRDDYPRLMSLMGSLADAHLMFVDGE